MMPAAATRLLGRRGSILPVSSHPPCGPHTPQPPIPPRGPLYLRHPVLHLADSYPPFKTPVKCPIPTKHTHPPLAHPRTFAPAVATPSCVPDFPLDCGLLETRGKACPPVLLSTWVWLQAGQATAPNTFWQVGN